MTYCAITMEKPQLSMLDQWTKNTFSDDRYPHSILFFQFEVVKYTF